MLKNIFITISLLTAATSVAFILFCFSSYDSTNIALIYILALVLIGRYTTGYVPGILASVISVMCVNCIFTYPYLKLNFTIKGYPVTFITMLAISIITSTTTTHLKRLAYALAEKEKLIMEAEKEKMRANLLRAISHDLRTPLTSIIGASSSLVNEEISLSQNESTEICRHIQEDAHWLLNMVENILSVTKIQDGTSHLKKTPEALEEVMTESVLRIKKRIPDADIHTRLPEEFLLIPMDALLIEQVIINLLENAIKHSKTSEGVDFFTTADDSNVTIHIRDYGIGINISPSDKIFDIYSSKESNISDSEKGTGIGLSICKTIVLAHGGEIHAINHDKGSEFYFTLPRENI
ncbi:MAG: DUF4118 domain-containing protein [Eubacterium sp.]